MKIRTRRVLSNITLIVILLVFTGCKLEDKKVYYYELTLINESDSDILFVSVKTGVANNDFGFLGSGTPQKGKRKGKVAAGCAVSFNGDTKITWEDDNDNVHEFDLDLKKYYSQKNQIKGFEFIYKGNDKWNVIVKK